VHSPKFAEDRRHHGRKPLFCRKDAATEFLAPSTSDLLAFLSPCYPPFLAAKCSSCAFSLVLEEGDRVQTGSTSIPNLMQQISRCCDSPITGREKEMVFTPCACESQVANRKAFSGKSIWNGGANVPVTASFGIHIPFKKSVLPLSASDNGAESRERYCLLGALGLKVPRDHSSRCYLRPVGAGVYPPYVRWADFLRRKLRRFLRWASTHGGRKSRLFGNL